MDAREMLKRRGRPPKADSVRATAKKINEQLEVLQNDQPDISIPAMEQVAEMPIVAQEESIQEVTLNEIVREEAVENNVIAEPQVTETVESEPIEVTSNVDTQIEAKEEEKIVEKQPTTHILEYKYEIGSQVFVPEYTQIQHINEYGVVQPKYGYAPISVKIAEVCYSKDKVRYRFFNKQKLIVVESLICTTEYDCMKLCEGLNNRNAR